MTDYAGDITPDRAWELLSTTPGAVLVDVRTEGEWREVGVPLTPPTAAEPVFIEWVSAPSGMLNPAFLEQLAQAGIGPEHTGPVIFLCRSGQRSMGAATAATAAGIGECLNVVGGFEGGTDALGRRGVGGWQASGLPWHRE